MGETEGMMASGTGPVTPVWSRKRDRRVSATILAPVCQRQCVQTDARKRGL